MIRENQKLLNRLHVLSDGVILYLSMPLAFWVRFFVLPGGYITVPLPRYLVLAVALTAIQMFICSAFGLYRSFRSTPLRKELPRLWRANLLDLALLLSWLFLSHEEHFSRLVLGLWFLLSTAALTLKRIVLRRGLRRLRRRGYNRKNVLVVGAGEMVERYLAQIRLDKELGYQPIGQVADQKQNRGNGDGDPLPYLGNYGSLKKILESTRPDEVVAALPAEDYAEMPKVIAACEGTGCKLSIIPFYAEYMPSHPQFDDLDGIPMLNIRHIPLDNWLNAFAKRTMDIVGSGLLLILLSPVLAVCAAGVKLSSPGPAIFRQERVGRNKKRFYMYKFRSMRVNDAQDTAWSSREDSRKTRFGAFLRKCSLDELPQLWNVFRGDMSLVGPRPEIPYYVDRFKEEVPLYMVKHQVRPGITGWAQINGFRGDTSIRGRIEHDIYYIENWSLLFDLRILWNTVFGGKFINGESMK